MDTVQLEGSVESIIFRNEDNGYTVFELSVTHNGEADAFLITAVGNLFAVAQGQILSLDGQWIDHAQYGQQFKIDHYKQSLPSSREEIEKYLQSGFIKGLGPVTAHNIVAVFGMDSLRIIANEPERLIQIRGISSSRAKQISQSFNENSADLSTLAQLHDLGFTHHQAQKINQCYGDMALDIIQTDPYRLLIDISGIGFRVLDHVAHQRLGFRNDAPERIQGGILYTLQWLQNDGGHTCYPINALCNIASQSLILDPLLVSDQIDELILQNRIISLLMNNQPIGALPALYKQETNCAHQLLLLQQEPSAIPLFDVLQQLDALERENDLILDPQQRQAVLNAFQHGVLIITGGPGTGKTTIIHFILLLMESLNLSCKLCAPTGRAAKRMSDATQRPAQTIHRLLEYTGSFFARNRDAPIDAHVIIIDEASMIDVTLFYHLMDATSQGTRIILVGDANQLPSVGAGNVLKDIIQSNIFPVARLTEVFRQARQSRIITNAHRIHDGEMPLLDLCDDFAFQQLESQQQILQSILGICQRKKLGDIWHNLQILTPIKKGLLGTLSINQALQSCMNPADPQRNELQYGDFLFREHDKIMQIRNDYTMEWFRGDDSGQGVFNGDIGIIRQIDHERHVVEVHFDDDRFAYYEFKDLKNIQLAYAMSIHKSQGSEFPIVLMPVFRGPSLLMTRNLLYTAITRARQCVVLIGQKEAIQFMINNTHEQERYSTLEHTLLLLHPLFLSHTNSTEENTHE